VLCALRRVQTTCVFSEFVCARACACACVRTWSCSPCASAFSLLAPVCSTASMLASMLASAVQPHASALGSCTTCRAGGSRGLQRGRRQQDKRVPYGQKRVPWAEACAMGRSVPWADACYEQKRAMGRSVPWAEGCPMVAWSHIVA